MKKAIVIALLLVSSAATAAPSNEDIARAHTFFDAGAQAYAAARYEDAARSFEQAYALAPKPQVLFSLAQAERKSFYATSDASYGKHAVEHYRAYLEQVPSGGRRSEATEGKADLENRLRSETTTVVQAAPEKRKPRVTVVSATPGAKAQLDGKAAEELPFFSDLEPGRHKVRIFADGFFDEEREVSGDKPGDVPIDAPLKEKPAKLTVAYDGAGEVYVDGRLLSSTPTNGAIDVASGPHVISLAVNGKKVANQDVQLERGKPFTFTPHLETSNQRFVAWSMIGFGAAGVIAGGVLGGLALGQESKVRDIESEAAQQNISANRLQSHNDAIDRRDTFRTASIVSLSVGGALAAGGVALFLFDKPRVDVVPPRSREPVPPPVTKPLDVAAYPVLGPDTFGAGIVGRF